MQLFTRSILVAASLPSTPFCAISILLVLVGLACMRGFVFFAGWLFRREGLLFAVLIAPDSRGIAAVGGDAENMAEAAGGRDAAHEWYAGEPRMVNVVGMSEGHGGELADCNSKDLSMLLRLQGPEALAEVRGCRRRPILPRSNCR